MAKKADMPCSRCGELMWRSQSTLPEGQAVCRPCRRQQPMPYGPRGYVNPANGASATTRTALCPTCGVTFETNRATKVYCSIECRPPKSRYYYGSATSRGYGAEHQAERKRLKSMVDAGQVDCCLCGEWIEPGTPWHLDHTPDRTAHRGPAHVSCNTRDGAIRGGGNRPESERDCPTCGSVFVTIYPRHIYCSKRCRPSMQRA